MTDVKVSFYLKRNEEKPDGTVPVLGRIRIGKSMVQFSAKVSVPASLWDTKSGRAIGKSKTALTINAALDKICVAVHSAYRELSAKTGKVSAQDVKNAFQGIASQQDTVIGHYEKYNENVLKSAGVSRTMNTCKRYGISLGHLKRFLRVKFNANDLPLRSITLSFVESFDFYLRVERRLAPRTVNGILVHLRLIVKSALNEGLLRDDPFIGYEYIYAPIVPKSLTAAELKRIMNTPLSRPCLCHVRDMFLFSAFTGIAFSDVRNLTEKNLSQAEDGVIWIHTKRQKTGAPCHIPLLEIPLKIIEKYRQTDGDGKLLPMISCSKTNLHLKKIAKACKIEKNLTYHMARHTYASVVTLSEGVPLETVGELLGHRDWRATRIYARVNNDKIGEDMRRLEKHITGKFRLAGAIRDSITN